MNYIVYKVGIVIENVGKCEFVCVFFKPQKNVNFICA